MGLVLGYDALQFEGGVDVASDFAEFAVEDLRSAKIIDEGVFVGVCQINDEAASVRQQHLAQHSAILDQE